MFGRSVGWVLVLTIVGSLALGQNVQGDLGGIVNDPNGQRSAYVGPEAVAAALRWSEAPVDEALKDRWLSTFHRSLVTAAPEANLARYAADDLCGFIGGSGGTSKLDGGGWLEALNPREFDPVRDRTSLVTTAGFLRQPPTRLVVIDEFDLGALALELAESEAGDFASLFLGTGIVEETTFGYELLHGHLVVHHVAALLDEMGYVPSTDFEAGDVESVPFLRLGFAKLGSDAVVVDLVDGRFDDLSSLQAALFAVARSADEPAAVVLSWGLTGCALRDAYAVRSTRTDGLIQVTDFVSLSDFAVAVATAYDVIVSNGGATPVTRSICDAVDAYSRFAVTRSSGIGCGDRDVRVVVATTVLFGSYAVGAEAVFDEAAADGGRASADAHRYFAAAGNEGLPYPMPPASFDWVTAVAACKPTGPARALFSNAGDRYGFGGAEVEVIALGAWFPAQIHRLDGRDLGYWGTSFAAPLAALASGVGREDAEIPPVFATLCGPARWSEPSP